MTKRFQTGGIVKNPWTPEEANELLERLRSSRVPAQVPRCHLPVTIKGETLRVMTYKEWLDENSLIEQ